MFFCFCLSQVLLSTTCGEIDIELWSKEAPKACRNFIQLCLEGYYDGTIFHRVVKGKNCAFQATFYWPVKLLKAQFKGAQSVTEILSYTIYILVVSTQIFNKEPLF